MSSTIKIKRSEVAGNPAVLGAGELAYSAADYSAVQGGGRLYVGIGQETDGNAVNHIVIGGKYFTDMLDHSPGTLTASSALVVDENSKLNNLKIDNLDLDGNTLKVTDVNGNLNLSGNGTGLVNVSKLQVADIYSFPTTDGSAGNVLSTNGSGVVSWTAAAANLAVLTDSGSDTLDLVNDTLTVAGTSGLTTSFDPALNKLIIAAAVAAPGIKGIAEFSVDHFEVTGGLVAIKDAAIKDIVGTLVTGNTETGVSVVYNTTTKKLDFAVANLDITVDGDVTGTTTVTGPNTATVTIDIAANSISNTMLDNSTITLGTTSIDLGQTITILNGLEQVSVDSLTLTNNELSVDLLNADLSLRANGTGNVTVNNARVTGVATPVNDTDAANKAYVDNAVTGLSWKDSVSYLANSNIVLTGSTGSLVLDGITLNAGFSGLHRVLLIAQTDATQNGIYVYTDNGTSYTLTRSEDTNTYQELVGTSVLVTEGTEYANTGWVQSNQFLNSFASQDWVQFSGSGAYSAGNGLSLLGTTFSVNVAATGGIELTSDSLQLKSSLAGDGLAYSAGVLSTVGTANRIVVSGSGVDIAATYVGQDSITTLGTVTTGTWTAGVVGATYGGTGLSSFAAGDLLVAGANNTFTKLAIQANGKILQSNGTTLVYADIDGGTY